MGGISIKKKKIAFVVECMGSGILTYLIQLCNNICKDYDLTIFYGVREQTPSNLRELFSNDINLVEIKNFKREISIKSDLKAYKEIKKHLINLNPDIVHLNSSKAGAIGRILKLINFRNFKKVSFIYTPHGYSFQITDSSKIKCLIYFVIEKILGFINSTTVACGEGEYILSKKVSRKSTFVNNCVDLNNLSDIFEDNNYENVFYTIGRISYQKNPFMFNEIAQKNPKKKFVWVGDGPYREVLTSPNIQVTGWMDHDDAIKYVEPFKFFVLCSKWEGLPLSLLEAMSRGKICFVSNIIGNKEVISNKENGYILDTTDTFNDVLSGLNDSEMNLISKKAINTIEKDFSLEKFIEGYKRIYKKISD